MLAKSVAEEHRERESGESICFSIRTFGLLREAMTKHEAANGGHRDERSKRNHVKVKQFWLDVRLNECTRDSAARYKYDSQ